MAIGFEKHVFISYAHLDNIPIKQGDEGWVSRLHVSLYSMLSRRLGCEALIWRDTKLKGDDVFSDEIVGQVAMRRGADIGHQPEIRRIAILQTGTLRVLRGRREDDGPGGRK